MPFKPGESFVVCDAGGGTVVSCSLTWLSPPWLLANKRYSRMSSVTPSNPSARFALESASMATVSALFSQTIMINTDA